MNIIDINLQHLKPYLDNQDYIDLSIKEEGVIWCKRFDGLWQKITNPEITKIYLQGLFRLIATTNNKEIQDIDNFRENLDLRLDGNIHRVNLVFGGSKGAGFGITIRLKRNRKITLDDFVINPKDKEKIISLIKQQKNILISGGVGTGKTTFLNALLSYIEDKHNKRIITVENASEIDLSSFPNSYPFIYEKDTEKDVLDVLNDCFRSSPDILILGELRQENSLPFLRFINSGHDGTFSTIHASDCEGALAAIAANITAIHANKTTKQIIEELKLRLSCVIQLKKIYPKNEKAQVIVREVLYL